MSGSQDRPKARPKGLALTAARVGLFPAHNVVSSAVQADVVATLDVRTSLLYVVTVRVGGSSFRVSLYNRRVSPHGV
jgi:hypothetical protein